MIPIAFVDDQKFCRDAIIRVINYIAPNVYQFYEYEDGQVFIDRFPTENYTPALVLMDLSMPITNGYDTTVWIKKHYPTIPVLILSFIDKPNATILLVKCGANGQMDKNDIGDGVLFGEVIERMIAGEEYFKDPTLHAFAKKRMAMPKKKLFEGIDSLTKEEINLVRMIAYDRTLNEKAKEQFISPSGYKRRLFRVLKKLSVPSSEGLRNLAVSLGIVFEK